MTKAELQQALILANIALGEHNSKLDEARAAYRNLRAEAHRVVTNLREGLAHKESLIQTLMKRPTRAELVAAQGEPT